MHVPDRKESGRTPHWLKREDMISQQIMGTIMELALFCFSELKEYEVFGS